jgi:hypothetical protein
VERVLALIPENSTPIAPFSSSPSPSSSSSSSTPETFYSSRVTPLRLKCYFFSVNCDEKGGGEAHGAPATRDLAGGGRSDWPKRTGTGACVEFVCRILMFLTLCFCIKTMLGFDLLIETVASVRALIL